MYFNMSASTANSCESKRAAKHILGHNEGTKVYHVQIYSINNLNCFEERISNRYHLYGAPLFGKKKLK